MAKKCEVCGKGAQLGNQVTIRGKQKYLGGVGTKVTGISRRKFKPNLQRIKVEVDGQVKTMRVSVSAIRAGLVKRPARKKPFTMPQL